MHLMADKMAEEKYNLPGKMHRCIIRLNRFPLVADASQNEEERSHILARKDFT